MRFYRSLDRFEGRSAVGTYLVRITINLCLNELKRRQRRRRLFLSSTEETMESLPDQNQGAHRRNSLDNKNAVRQAIQKLDPKFRAVIVLRLIDGYSTQETASILDLPTGTVLSRLARAQKKLKKILDPSAATAREGESQ